jgi:transcriptional regulator with XRE-family HTH domain
MSLAQKIRERLEVTGLSQSDLRRSLALHGAKVSRQTVSGWCTGVHRPMPGHFRALLDALMVPLKQRDDWFDSWMR